MAGSRSVFSAFWMMACAAASASPVHAQISLYASRAWSNADSPTVPVNGFGVSLGREWVIGFDDLRGTAERTDSPYGSLFYCDEAGLCPPQRTRVHQGYRSVHVGRRFNVATLEGARIAVVPKLAASFVRESREGLENPAALAGDQGSVTAAIALEASRTVRGRWAVLLFGEVRRQIREPSKCVDCHTPLRDGFTLQQISLGVTRQAR